MPNVNEAKHKQKIYSITFASQNSSDLDVGPGTAPRAQTSGNVFLCNKNVTAIKVSSHLCLKLLKQVMHW